MDPSSSSSSSSSNIYHPNPNWLSFSLFHPTPLASSSADHHPTTEEDPPPPPPVSVPDPSIFACSVPQLADFFGGTALAAHFPPPPVEDDSPVVISDLKTITASFLRGFSGDGSRTCDDRQMHRPQELQLAASDGGRQQQVGKKAVDTFGQRTSIYRGVTRHRWTGRYEAHLWDNSCRREGQSRKGRQVYLGGYDKEDKAARAYDLAALKYWGTTTTTNFPVCNYEKDVEEMKHMTRQEFIASLRRKSSGFSRGASIYRGVTRHHQHGRWQARIGRVAGNKDLYLGTFSTQEEAAEAYDIAAIKFRGLNAVTNFDMSRYDVKSIMSSNLPIGGMSGKSKNSPESPNSDNGRSHSDDRDGLSPASSLSFSSHCRGHQQPHNPLSSSSMSTMTFAIPIKADPSDSWPMLGYNHQNARGNSFSHSSALYENHHPNSFDFQGGIYVQQQQCDGASLPYATIAANADSTCVGAGPGAGSWMMMGPPPPPTLHSFQTPIYGME